MNSLPSSLQFSSAYLTYPNPSPEKGIGRSKILKKFKAQIPEDCNKIEKLFGELCKPYTVQEDTFKSLKDHIFKSGGLELNNENSCPLICLRKCIYTLETEVGAGANSVVIETRKLVITHNTPIKSGLVLKKAKKPFDNELKINNKLRKKVDKTDLKYFDLLQSVHEISEPTDGRKYVGVYNKSESDFLNIVYADSEMAPSKLIFPKLKDLAIGLKTLHEAGFVHRDIKGANCLFNSKSEAKIADLEYVTEIEEGTIKSTPMTPFYAAPFIWANFENKKAFKGEQGKESDAFSFGRMLQYDIIAKFLSQMGAKHSIEIEKLLTEIRPAKEILFKCEEMDIEENKNVNSRRDIPENISDEMKKRHNNAPNHVFFSIKWSESKKLSEVSTLTFSDRENILKKTEEAITLLSAKLPANEISNWKQLAKIAHDLQASVPSELPSMQEVIERFNQITPHFSPITDINSIFPSSSESCMSSRKRRIRPDDTTNSSPQNKKIKLENGSDHEMHLEQRKLDFSNL